MDSRVSPVSIITPFRDEDLTSELRNMVSDTSDIHEDFTASPSSTEDFIGIWLNLTTDDSNDNMNDSISKLQHMVDTTIKIFQDPNECIEFLTDIKYESVFMIISGSQLQSIVSLIENIPKLRFIYILDSQSANDELWTQGYKKVRGIFTQIDDICDILKKDICALMIHFTPFSIISATSTDPNELDQSFMYTQLLKGIILKVEYDENARKEFVDLCLIDYQNNAAKRAKVEDFDRIYKDHSPIWWYTEEPFIYSKVNKALRTQDIETIIKMGFFLQDLH